MKASGAAASHPARSALKSSNAALWQLNGSHQTTCSPLYSELYLQSKTQMSTNFLILAEFRNEAIMCYTCQSEPLAIVKNVVRVFHVCIFLIVEVAGHKLSRKISTLACVSTSSLRASGNYVVTPAGGRTPLPGSWRLTVRCSQLFAIPRPGHLNGLRSLSGSVYHY